jgi:hypothetical protein
MLSIPETASARRAFSAGRPMNAPESAELLQPSPDASSPQQFFPGVAGRDQVADAPPRLR